MLPTSPRSIFATQPSMIAKWRPVGFWTVRQTRQIWSYLQNDAFFTICHFIGQMMNQKIKSSEDE